MSPARPEHRYTSGKVGNPGTCPGSGVAVRPPPGILPAFHPPLGDTGPYVSPRCRLARLQPQASRMSCDHLESIYGIQTITDYAARRITASSEALWNPRRAVKRQRSWPSPRPASEWRPLLIQQVAHVRCPQRHRLRAQVLPPAPTAAPASARSFDSVRSTRGTHRPAVRHPRSQRHSRLGVSRGARSLSGGCRQRKIGRAHV